MMTQEECTHSVQMMMKHAEIYAYSAKGVSALKNAPLERIVVAVHASKSTITTVKDVSSVVNLVAKSVRMVVVYLHVANVKSVSKYLTRLLA